MKVIATTLLTTLLLLATILAGAAEKENATADKASIAGLAFVTLHPASQVAMLRWGAMTSGSQSGYVIERAGTDLKWEMVETVSSHDAAQKLSTYRWFDQQPLEGLNYYRIKQTDATGQIRYSAVRSFFYTPEVQLTARH